MLTRIVEENLSDGSSVYNLLIDDPSTDQQLTLHCTDMEAAVRLEKMLSELTVDF